VGRVGVAINFLKGLTNSGSVLGISRAASELFLSFYGQVNVAEKG
jgi:hypothetical protein